MLEINEKQLLSFDNVNRARILKMIVLGLVKYKGDDTNDRTQTKTIRIFKRK